MTNLMPSLTSRYHRSAAVSPLKESQTGQESRKAQAQDSSLLFIIIIYFHSPTQPFLQDVFFCQQYW